MSSRSKALWSVIAGAMLLLLGAAPAAARPQNVCVSYDGVNYVELGSASCYSESGNIAVAVGDYSNADGGRGGFLSGTGGNGNTAIAIGDDSDASAGNGGFFGGDGGNNNEAIAIGDDSSADAGNGAFLGGDGGNNNEAIAIGDDNEADSGNGSFLGGDGDDGCVSVVTDYYVFESDECFDFDFGI